MAVTWGPFPAYPVFASSAQAVSRSQCTDSMPHWPRASFARSVAPARSASRLVAVHGHPAPSLTALSLIHGYTTGFWVAAVIFATGAVICGTLFRPGPLLTSRPAAPGPAPAGAQQDNQAPVTRT